MNEPESATGPVLRTIDVARASGYSVQQVRDLERFGVIPPAVRSANGYRSYGPIHVAALRGYRALAGAAGPVSARSTMAAFRTEGVAERVATIDAAHATLARERAETLRAGQAIMAISGEPEALEREPDRDAMTITELAGALGVRTSTLRFWEQEGLVRPDRVTSHRTRRYEVPAIRAARIVVALRNAGTGIPTVRELLGALESFESFEDADEATRILRRRLDRIATRSLALLDAGADLAALINAIPEPR
ncbi:MerR family transcriptional regulator [Agromyces cerinus]|uniref:DNA-binding transcriptional regulator, MerR family n=1 Tax=Agromyces cerinus subsp. cerinus TaxID=232089 RepID=A0A1N6EKZ6_9MICO|nr:MerR family transcriptional regulator [Agromyces cerinus]SIN83716.1 DNA-binding transcriptional regulator, MerR family [Agromyces cerinus subsp. cerinus]